MHFSVPETSLFDIAEHVVTAVEIQVAGRPLSLCLGGGRASGELADLSHLAAQQELRPTGGRLPGRDDRIGRAGSPASLVAGMGIHSYLGP